MLRRLKRRIPAPSQGGNLRLSSTGAADPNPTLLLPSLLPASNELSSLLPPSLNPSTIAVDLICRRLNQQFAAASPAAALLLPAESHLLPHLGAGEICRIILRSQSHPLATLHFFNWVRSSLSPALLPPESFFLLAHILAHCHFFSSAMAVLSDLVLSTSCDAFRGLANASELCNRDPAVFGMLIKVYSKLDKLDQAIDTLKKTIAAGFPVRADDVNSLLNGLSRAGRHGDCWQIYEELKRAGIVPNGHTFNILTGVLCNSGGVDRFGDFMAEMEMAGFDPDIVTYNTLIHGFSKRGRIEEAMNLYRIMYRRGLQPDVITYTALIKGMGREGKAKDAHQLFDRMHHRGFFPDNHAYNALISAYSKESKIREGRKLLKEMIQSGLKPDRFTCRALFEGYRKSGNLIAFLNPLVQLRSRGGNEASPSVPSKIYKTLIAALCERKRPSAARSLFLLFLEDGHEPDLELYNGLIKGFCDCDLLAEAFELEEEMAARGIAPDSATFAAQVKCLCGRGRTGEAERLMRKMARAGLAPTAEMCAALVEGLCRERDYGGAERVLREMAEEFQVVAADGYNALLGAYSAEGDVGKSFELQERMLRFGGTPNTRTCRLLIRSLVEARAKPIKI